MHCLHIMVRFLTMRALTTGLVMAGFSTAQEKSGQRSDDDERIVKAFVEANYQEVFREPNGTLNHPYLVPGGPYDQSWDWDSVFTGVALLDLGSAPYLAGAMMNFFDQTNETTGEVTICVDPTTTSPSCSSDPSDNISSGSHAKPVLIQGALAAAEHTNDWEQFRPYSSKMSALLAYWSTQRKHSPTGLFTWHDQMESGADNLVLSACPSPRSDCWVEEGCGNSLSSPDLMAYLYRENLAYARFLDRWNLPGSDRYEAAAASVKETLEEQLWSEEDGFHLSRNVTDGSDIGAPTYALGVPLWMGPGGLEAGRAERVVERLTKPDMLGEYGIRSTSSDNPDYNNDDVITPYSNWRGPVWVNANVVVAYGMLDFGYYEEAAGLAVKVMKVLADDLRATGEWHEDYDAEAGGGGLGARLSKLEFVGVQAIRRRAEEAC